MKFLIIGLLTLSSLSAWSSTAYTARVNPNGEFRLTLTQEYPANVSLVDIFYEGYFNTQLQTEMDDLIVDHKMSINPKILYNKLSSELIDFKMTVVAQKFEVFKRRLVSDCQINVEAELIEMNCSPNMREGAGKSHFEYSQTRTVCRGGQDQVKTCELVTRGKPKGFNLVLVNYTPPHLAISGIESVIKRNYRMAHHVSGLKTAVEQTTFYRENISGLWTFMMNHLDRKSRLPHSFELTSGTRGYVIKPL